MGGDSQIVYNHIVSSQILNLTHCHYYTVSELASFSEESFAVLVQSGRNASKFTINKLLYQHN